MPNHPTLWLSLFLVVASQAQEAAPEPRSQAEWANALGSPDPAIREQANKELVAAQNAEEVLQALVAHENPWVAARAKRLMWLKQGIDPRLAPALQEEIHQFGTLNAERQEKVLEGLTRRAPGHLSTLAHLHERQWTAGSIKAEDRAGWHEKLKSSAASNPADIDPLKIEELGAHTLGAIFSGRRDTRSEQAAALYAKWREQHPELGKHLSGFSANLEVNYLLEKNKINELLAYLPLLQDSTTRRSALRPAMAKLLKWQPAKLEDMTKTQAIGHLMLQMAISDERLAEQWYAKHHKVHPELPNHLPAELLPLEIKRLLAASRLSDALELAFNTRPTDPRRDFVSYDLHRALSEAMGSDPKKLPKGLPDIADMQAHPRMARLLGSWFPSSPSSSRLEEMKSKVDCFDRWAKDGAWLEATKHHGPKMLYTLVMAKRGKLAELVREYEFADDHQSLRALGSLILRQGDLTKQIPHQQCSVKTLRHLLDGAMSSLGMISSDSSPLIQLASTWQQTYPELLAEGSFPDQPFYAAMLMAQNEGLELAMAALLAETQPEGGARQMRACILLANLISAHPEADIAKLLPADQTSKTVLEKIFQRFSWNKEPDAAEVRTAIQVAKLMRTRFKMDQARPLISNHRARSFAFNAWMAGKDALAAEFLLETYLANHDTNEQYDGAFAHLLVMLEHGELALKQLEAMDPESGLPKAARLGKRARLLDAMGRRSGPLAELDPKDHPKLCLRLAIEAEDWKVARGSLPGQSGQAARNSSKRACISAMSFETDPAKYDPKNGHAVLALHHGKAVRDEDLLAMARDAELLARKQAVLMESLANRTPVPAMAMAEYFRYLDLIPDREKAIRIAYDLGKKEECTVFGRSREPDNQSVHKIVAAEALLLLGHGDKAFDVMRPLLEISRSPHLFKHVRRGATGGQSMPVFLGYQQAVILAQLEWPDLNQLQRVEQLAAILNQKDPHARCKDMLGLIAKHESELKTHDLLWAMHLPFMDLAHAAEVPDELKKQPRAWLETRKADKAQRQRLERSWQRTPWELETTHRPMPGGTKAAKTTVTIEPKPGNQSNARSKDFVLLDGLHRALAQHKAGKTAEAQTQLKEVTMRLLFDPTLLRQESKWSVSERTPAGHYSSTSGASGFHAALRYFSWKGLPPELTTPWVAACANTDTNYSDDERLLHAARIHVRAGEWKKALAYHRRYLIATIPAFGSRDIGLSGRKEILEMQRVHALVSAQGDDTELTKASVLRLIQLAPYEPEKARDVAAVIQKKWEAHLLMELRETVDQYWRARLLEIPDSKTYAYWREKWRQVFP